MKQLISISLLLYYCFGTLCLPMGDFSILPKLQEIYHHCKNTEHHDMNVLDFVSDHLINIDGIFDKHDNGDEQKPHQPIKSQHQTQIFVSLTTSISYSKINVIIAAEKPIIKSVFIIPSGYIADIFRPPIVYC